MKTETIFDRILNQMEILIAAVKELDSAVASLEQSIDNLEGTISVIDDKISNIDDNIITMQRDVSDIDDKVSNEVTPDTILDVFASIDEIEQDLRRQERLDWMKEVRIKRMIGLLVNGG
jgi:predicted  nucleic acid-binding Zn-ribbon protein